MCVSLILRLSVQYISRYVRVSPRVFPSGANDASIVLKTPRNQTASISMVEHNGTEFHLMSRGANDSFVINDGTNDLLALYPSTQTA